MASVNWQLWGALAMAGVGAVILLAMVAGCAAGLFVLMYRVCSGDARIVRANRSRRPARHVIVPYPNGANSSVASLLSGGASETTAPMEAYRDE